MWIVLLDRSESMDEPFCIDWQKSKQRDSVWLERVPTKLEAARNSLAVPLEVVQRSQPLTLLGFAGNTSILFESRPGLHLDARQALEDLVPAPGYDIAQALRAARASFWSMGSSRREGDRIHLLVITHELSDQVGIEQAVKELVELAETKVTIDVILVDPSDKSRSVAGVIAKSGHLHTAASASHLRAVMESVLLGRVGREDRPPSLEEAVDRSVPLEVELPAEARYREEDGSGRDLAPPASPTVMMEREWRGSGPPQPSARRSVDEYRKYPQRARIIGFPARSIALAVMLILASAYLVFSGNDAKSTGIFSRYSAEQNPSGVLLSWQTHSDDRAESYRIETRAKPGEVTAVESSVSRVAESQYSAADNSAEARSGRRLEYRLIHTDASGQETSTPWIGITQVVRSAAR